MWGRGHCTTALFFLQGEAALCKASPFTTKPARVGKPSPRRSPEQIPSSQREGGYSFLYSPLFAFFMRTVSHTLARQHPRCEALFYSGDSLRFPAYNGNEMPSWYTKVPVVYKPRCLPLFFLCGLLRQFARVCERLPPQCPGTPRVKPSGKSRLFSDRGGKVFFMVSVSQRKLFFLCPVLCGCVGVEGAFPCGGIPSWNRKEKRLPRPLPARGARLQTDAEPGYFPL